jgi:precorrin-6x reductase
MSGSVTIRAQCDEILFRIIPQPAARANVVDLKIVRPAAVLAAPPIAREHRAGELAIRFGFKP